MNNSFEFTKKICANIDIEMNELVHKTIRTIANEKGVSISYLLREILKKYKNKENKSLKIGSDYKITLRLKVKNDTPFEEFSIYAENISNEDLLSIVADFK